MRVRDSETENEESGLIDGPNNSRSSTAITTETKVVTCCDRIKLLFAPIQSFKTVYENGDAETHIVIIPESFRMLFYFGFFGFMALAMGISKTWADIDYENNLMKQLFGANNFCIYFDDPPFSLFSTTVWVPVVFCLILYEFFDYFRVYDSYHDGEISKAFFRFYSVMTVYEVIAIWFSIQFTATTPYESVYLHAIPYVFLTYAMMTLALKRYLYLSKTGFFESGNYHKCWKPMGSIYVALVLITGIIKTAIIMPNLFGAQLWTIPGMEWIGPLTKYNADLHNLLILVVPIVIYFALTKDLKTIKLIVDRSHSHKQRKSMNG